MNHHCNENETRITIVIQYIYNTTYESNEMIHKLDSLHDTFTHAFAEGWTVNGSCSALHTILKTKSIFIEQWSSTKRFITNYSTTLQILCPSHSITWWRCYHASSVGCSPAPLLSKIIFFSNLLLSPMQCPLVNTSEFDFRIWLIFLSQLYHAFD